MQRFCTVLSQVVKYQKGLRNNFAKGQFKLELSNRNMKKWMKKEIDWTEDVGRNDGLRAGFKKWGEIKKYNWVLKEDLESDNLVDQQSPHN